VDSFASKHVGDRCFKYRKSVTNDEFSALVILSETISRLDSTLLKMVT